MLSFAMHFASGNSLVSGLVMLFVAYALIVLTSKRSRWRMRTLRLLVFLGAAFVVLSTTPLPRAVWAALGISLLPLLAALVMQSNGRPGPRSARAGALMFTAVAAGVLWSEYVAASTRLPAETATLPIIVLGDSLSAAETDPKLTAWPELIAAHGWRVTNNAGIGATAATALRQVASVDTSDAIVLILIGGNDLLGPTTPGKFEEALEELVSTASTKGTQVVLFELPLPPFRFEWGAIQRRIAKRHEGCRLVSRRIMAAVLGGDGNTVDGIHLSQKGHDEMARLVMETVLPPR
ncbi:Esterase TesA precursor [Caulifigura coniformis]|uniref:Esterase TesA n=1 Tax=Caulifigura coniformis TaxID=2527983 RepID=A0A517S7K8_9PLAN|nr:GDSL-type esterase/lipase family protein [Caulifigura coniformis]QDT52093.1 Esterase TesA precursor [Caulifigura coniformis]